LDQPVSHDKKHGVPLYDGTIFHRVIPQFMIQVEIRRQGFVIRLQIQE